MIPRSLFTDASSSSGSRYFFISTANFSIIDTCATSFIPSSLFIISPNSCQDSQMSTQKINILLEGDEFPWKLSCTPLIGLYDSDICLFH